jgi:CBS domain containing-hemolysin-like protein
MNWTLEVLTAAACLGFLFYLSLVESAIVQSRPLILRMLTERAVHPAPPLLPVVLEDKMEILGPVHLGNQVSLITIAILVTHLCLRTWPEHGILYSFLAVILISVVFRQLLPRLLTQNAPEGKLMRLLGSFGSVFKVLRALLLPISSVWRLYRKLHEEVENGGATESEEATGEEIQAYLEIGEDEGILQEEDSKLIQSVVEFGNTLVREVMTPRTRIVACEEKATIAELREIMVRHRHSRIPVYRGDIDHIIGIVYIRQLVAEIAKGKESESIAGLVIPVTFVPGTKPVSKLLKELQERGDYVAIVIDEFGGVAGMVTIEDLVEEIIGEIRDEDEATVSQIVEEGPGSLLLRGGTELSLLEEKTGRRFENLNCTTVAGLVMAYLGRVPAPGETFEMDGMRVQVLDADRKRAHWIRIQWPGASGDKS